MRHVTCLLTLTACLACITTSQAEAAPPKPKLGVFLAFSENNAVVINVVEGSIAATFKIKRGDIILKLDDKVINTMQDADDFLNDCSEMRYVLYQRTSDNKKVEIKLAPNPYIYDQASMAYTVDPNKYTSEVLD